MTNDKNKLLNLGANLDVLGDISEKGLTELLKSQVQLLLAVGKAYPDVSGENQLKIAKQLIDQVSTNIEAGKKVAFIEELDNQSKEYRISIFGIKLKKKN